jgi:hypothetical protein
MLIFLIDSFLETIFDFVQVGKGINVRDFILFGVVIGFVVV